MLSRFLKWLFRPKKNFSMRTFLLFTQRWQNITTNYNFIRHKPSNHPWIVINQMKKSCLWQMIWQIKSAQLIESKVNLKWIYRWTSKKMLQGTQASFKIKLMHLNTYLKTMNTSSNNLWEILISQSADVSCLRQISINVHHFLSNHKLICLIVSIQILQRTVKATLSGRAVQTILLGLNKIVSQTISILKIRTTASISLSSLNRIRVKKLNNKFRTFVTKMSISKLNLQLQLK